MYINTRAANDASAKFYNRRDEEKAPTSRASASRCFQPGEGPCRGLLRDCENFADGSFAALINTVDKQYDHAVRLSLVCCVWGRPCSLIILNIVWTVDSQVAE